MINKVLTTIFGSKHERDVKRMLPAVANINSLEPEVSRMSDDQLRETWGKRIEEVVDHWYSTRAWDGVRPRAPIQAARASR